MKTRSKLAALLASGMLVLGVAGTAFAAEGNQTNVAYNAGPSDCTGGPGGVTIDPGDGVAWVFVHAATDATSGHLVANFASGQLEADSYIQGGLKYIIFTDLPETLLNFSDNIDGGQLTLSHTCYNTVTTSSSTTTSTSTSTSSSSTSTSTSFTESVSGTTDVIPSEPNTATLESSGSSAMSSGVWMLIAGIGVVGGSLLVLLPARAKNRR